MTERFTVDGLNIQDNAPKGYLYLLEEQGGVNALCNLLNGFNDKNNRLENENEQLKQKKERYKLLSEIRDEKINNRILTIKEFISNCSDDIVKNELENLFYSEVNDYDLAKENRKLKRENEQLKEFIKSLATNGKVLLSNGNVYDVKKIIGDVE